MYQLKTLPALNLYKDSSVLSQWKEVFKSKDKKQKVFWNAEMWSRMHSSVQRMGGGADGGLGQAGPIPRQAMSLSRAPLVLCGTSGGRGQAYRSPWKLPPGVEGREPAAAERSLRGWNFPGSGGKHARV